MKGKEPTVHEQLLMSQALNQVLQEAKLLFALTGRRMDEQELTDLTFYRMNVLTNFN